jgi:hypothetical protein
MQAYAGAATSIAVLGQADPAGAIGAIGKSSAGVGIKGVSDTGFPIIGQAVALRSTNPGTLGVGTAGPGVQGQSAAGHGLIGYTSASDGHAALIGYAQAAGGVGLIGVAPGSAGHWAGVFYGDVHINGTTSAPVHTTVVKHAGDNTSRALYSTISPESWVEDFGNGTLAGGKANIALDADFAALVDTRTMHLFMTAHGPHYLHVEQQTVAGFTVVATAIGSGQAGGPKPAEGGGTFSWRVVAKRKDIVGERLAKVPPPPPLKSMTPITVPETPAVKPPPRRPSE